MAAAAYPFAQDFQGMEDSTPQGERHALLRAFTQQTLPTVLRAMIDYMALQHAFAWSDNVEERAIQKASRLEYLNELLTMKTLAKCGITKPIDLLFKISQKNSPMMCLILRNNQMHRVDMQYMLDFLKEQIGVPPFKRQKQDDDIHVVERSDALAKFLARLRLRT